MEENKAEIIYQKVMKLFQVNIKAIFNDFNYGIESLHEIKDLVNDKCYFVLGIEDTDLRFLDRTSLYDVLIKFVNQQIASIPIELEDLEKERHNARYWDDVQHFYETESLSDKEGKLNKLKAKLTKEYNKLMK